MTRSSDTSPEPGAGNTVHLLRRVREGDEVAKHVLVARYRPILLQWAHGRVPASARGMTETEDLVQLTLMRVLDRLDRLESTREGAFLAYLRTVLTNLLRDELRKRHVRTDHAPLADHLAEDAASPLEEVIGRKSLAAYEAALESLSPLQREAVMLRLEFHFSYQEIAEAVESPSAAAARMLVVRSVERLATALKGLSESE